MEHRWGRRVTVDIPIQMTVANTPVMKQAMLMNLSATGALINADFRPRVLSRIQITIGSWLGRPGDAISIPAYVAHNYRHGIGVEWCESDSPIVNDLLKTAVQQSMSALRESALQLASAVASASSGAPPHTGTA